MVPCNAALLGALETHTLPETSGGDNLETLRLVFAAYDSAHSDRVIRLSTWPRE